MIESPDGGSFGWGRDPHGAGIDMNPEAAWGCRSSLGATVIRRAPPPGRPLDTYSRNRFAAPASAGPPPESS